MSLLDYQIQQEYSFINRFRQKVTDLVNTMDSYDELKKEYDNTFGVSGRLPDESFISQNAGLVKNDIVNGKSTFDALKAVFDNNNNYRLVLEVLKNPL